MEADAILQVPWVPCFIDDKQYLIKYSIHETSYQIMISDLALVYYEKLSKEELLHRSKELNPNIEIDVSRILKQVSKIFAEMESQEEEENRFHVLSKTESSLNLKSHVMLAGIPYVWKFTASLTKEHEVRDHLMLPLVGMVSELIRRQEELIQKIKRKDTEIEDYKMGGAKVSRKYLETVKFNEAFFIQETNCSKEIARNRKSAVESAFTGRGLELYKSVTSVMNHRTDTNSRSGSSSSSVQKSSEDTHGNVQNKTESSVPQIPQKEIELKRREELDRNLSEQVKKKKKKKLKL